MSNPNTAPYRRFQDRAGYTTHPQGWSVQPDDEWDRSWWDKVYECGDLRASEAAEDGGPIVPAQFGVSLKEISIDPHWRGHLLAQCWCGRNLVQVQPADVRAGRTGTCTYYRCEQIAGMSPARAAKLTPHQRASVSRKLRADRPNGERAKRAG